MTTKRQRPTILDDLEGAEDPDLHTATLRRPQRAVLEAFSSDHQAQRVKLSGRTPDGPLPLVALDTEIPWLGTKRG